MTEKIWRAAFFLLEDVAEIAIISAFLLMILVWAQWTMETVQ